MKGSKPYYYSISSSDVPNTATIMWHNYFSSPLSWSTIYVKPFVITQEVKLRWFQYRILHTERERNVLFNDALNTFYLRLYGVRHMVKDHSDSDKGNPLPPHRLLLSINSKGSFICTIPQTG